VTLDDTEHRRRYLNARATLSTLLALVCIPVINENDTVATAEIKFGDNDRLAARMAEMVPRGRCWCCCPISTGFTPPILGAIRLRNTCRWCPVLTPEIEAMGGDPPAWLLVWWHATKLVAARIATQAGVAMAIAQGNVERPLRALEDGRAAHGFLPTADGPSAWKRWISGSLASRGVFTVDVGAAERIARWPFAAAGRGCARSRNIPAWRPGAGTGTGRRGSGARPAASCRRDAVRIAGHRSDKIEAILG